MGLVFSFEKIAENGQDRLAAANESFGGFRALVKERGTVQRCVDGIQREDPGRRENGDVLGRPGDDALVDGREGFDVIQDHAAATGEVPGTDEVHLVGDTGSQDAADDAPGDAPVEGVEEDEHDILRQLDVRNAANLLAERPVVVCLRSGKADDPLRLEHPDDVERVPIHDSHGATGGLICRCAGIDLLLLEIVRQKGLEADDRLGVEFDGLCREAVIQAHAEGFAETAAKGNFGLWSDVGGESEGLVHSCDFCLFENIYPNNDIIFHKSMLLFEESISFDMRKKYDLIYFLLLYMKNLLIFVAESMIYWTYGPS